MLIARHGDLAIYKLDDTEEFDGKLHKHSGSVVLALGEATGHKHVATVEREEDMIAYLKKNGDWKLCLTAPAKITHNKHKPLVLQPGIYYVGKEREKDWFKLTTRRVID